MLDYYQRLYDAHGVDVGFEWACDVYGGHKVEDILSETRLLFDQHRHDLDNSYLARSFTKHSGSCSPGSKPTM